jgi:hypothetical protein
MTFPAANSRRCRQRPTRPDGRGRPPTVAAMDVHRCAGSTASAAHSGRWQPVGRGDVCGVTRGWARGRH